MPSLFVLASSRPLSRGEVKLNSANPDDAPYLDPNYLGEQADYNALYEAVQLCRKLGYTQAMQVLDEGGRCCPEKMQRKQISKTTSANPAAPITIW